MAMPRMTAGMCANGWCPAIDLYETDTSLILYMELSGVAPSSLSVLAEDTSITVSGERRCPAPEKIDSIHQLEIERGSFERVVSLPRPVDVASATSECRDGILVITLPLQRNRGKVRIVVE